jgi:acetylornithine deacetylase/succinyl-diaminopimelate desuccinylase-like protein
MRFISIVLPLTAVLPSAIASQVPNRQVIERVAAVEFVPAVERYRELLSLPNDAHFPDDIARLLGWLRGAFEARGFAVTELETPGSPLLLAERSIPGARRTVLFYLQADGQPVSPEHWHQESAYEPVLRERTGSEWRDVAWSRLSGQWDPEWRVFARSASDSKGPIAQFLAALTVADSMGWTPDFNLKVIIDGEEEMGSPHLPEAVERYSSELAADMLVILDGPPHVSNQPTLKFGARGIATFTLTTYGPRVPQHSGHYGNYAPNPALKLAQLLASMKDERGRVTIPGWYDGISLDRGTRATLDRVPDDEDAIRGALGIATTDDVGNSLQEAMQYPSLNIRGMSSGWVGEQRRTIVPATATAEVDVRLVLETDPNRLLGLVRDHIAARGYYLLDREPAEEERLTHPRIATFRSEISYLAFRTEFDSEPGRWLTNAMTRLYGEPPIKIRTSGGSIPISPFVQTLGVPAVSVPTVNPDNNQHSPNENLRLGNFLEGIEVILAVLTEPMVDQAS